MNKPLRANAAWPSDHWVPTCVLTLTCQKRRCRSEPSSVFRAGAKTYRGDITAPRDAASAVTAWQRNVIGFVTASTLDAAVMVQGEEPTPCLRQR